MIDETPPGDGEPHGGHRYEAAVMLEFPFLALGEGRTKEIRFPDKSKTITHVVTTDRAKGMAFVSDVNVIIWVITELRERIHVHEQPRSDIVLSIAHSELLRYIGKKPGGPQSKNLTATLERLCATCVETNLPLPMTGGKVSTFSLLERCVKDDPDATDPVWTITPPDWLIDVVQQNFIKRINPDSMKLHGIARCVYRYARAKVGEALISDVRLDPARAADRFGSTGKAPARIMRHKLKQLIVDLERTKALRSGKSTPNNVKPPGGEKSTTEREITIPDYLVAPSGPDHIVLTLDPDAWPLTYLNGP